MSPLELKCLLRMYYEPDSMPIGEIEESYCSHLVFHGILIKVGDYYETTVFGYAYVKLILRTPFPRVAYMGPDGVEITSD